MSSFERVVLNDSTVQPVLLEEVEIELNVKLECGFCYSGDTLGAEEGVKEG